MSVLQCKISKFISLCRNVPSLVAVVGTPKEAAEIRLWLHWIHIWPTHLIAASFEYHAFFPPPSFFWSIKWTKILQSNSKLVEMRWPSSQQQRFKRKAATRWKKFCIKHSKMHYSALIRFWIMEKKLTLQGAVCKTLSLAPRSSNTDAVGREVGEVRPILHSKPLKIQHAGFPCCHVKAGSVWNEGEKNVHFYSTDFLSYLPKWARNKI